MSKEKYSIESQIIANIAEIAIKCIVNHPPDDFNDTHIKLFVDFYSECKVKALNPQPDFHNLSSLKYIKNDLLTYFNENTGETVEAFWQEINSNNFDIQRVDLLEKILKRGKIKNDIEYQFIIDTYSAYTKSNLLSDDKIAKLNELILQYELKTNKV